MPAPLTLTRSLDAAEARATAPSTPDTPDATAVLLAALLSAVRTLQTTVAAQGTAIADLRSQIKQINHRET